MKKIFLLVLIALFARACSEGGQEEPLSENAKRSLLEEKKRELQKLEQEIKKLEAALGANAAEEKSALVAVLPVTRKTFRHYVEIQGTVQADDLIAVATETGGRLLELNVREGQYVKKGQLIARFDLSELEKQLAELEVSLELARDLYERQKRLWEQEIGSEVQYLQAKNQVERLEKSSEALQVRLAKAKVYAPISGEVERVMLKAGEVAGPGMPIVQLLNNKKVKVVAEVPENYLPIIKRRQPVEIFFPVLNVKRSARIDAIGQLINPSNRTFSVECRLTNLDGVLKPNLLGVIKFNDKTLKDAIVVPADLVQNEVGGTEFVFVLAEGDDGFYARKTYVKTGLRQGGSVVIEEGLEVGQQLIAEGAYKLIDGQKVHIKTTKQ